MILQQSVFFINKLQANRFFKPQIKTTTLLIWTIGNSNLNLWTFCSGCRQIQFQCLTFFCWSLENDQFFESNINIHKALLSMLCSHLDHHIGLFIIFEELDVNNNQNFTSSKTVSCSLGNHIKNSIQHKLESVKVKLFVALLLKARKIP